MFLEPDEYLLIMDMNVGGRVDLTLEEMRLLKGVGVKTLYYQAAIRWDVMQPEPGYPLDWSKLDTFVGNGRAAGLKMLIPFIYSLPSWKPDHWFYSRSVQGAAYGIPVIDNDEVTAELDDFIAQIIERYGGDDLQVVYAIPANGEFPFDLESGIQMPYPMEVFTNWLVDRQWQMVQQHGEVWTAYHPVANPGYWKPIYNALFDAYPSAKQYAICFTYVQHRTVHFFQLLKWNMERGVTYYAGTEYIEGMRQNVPKLIKGGVRMLTAPKHPWQPRRVIDRQALSEIEWALNQYKRHKVMA